MSHNRSLKDKFDVTENGPTVTNSRVTRRNHSRVGPMEKRMTMRRREKVIPPACRTITSERIRLSNNRNRQDPKRERAKRDLQGRKSRYSASISPEHSNENFNNFMSIIGNRSNLKRSQDGNAERRRRHTGSSDIDNDNSNRFNSSRQDQSSAAISGYSNLSQVAARSVGNARQIKDRSNVRLSCGQSSPKKRSRIDPNAVITVSDTPPRKKPPFLKKRKIASGLISVPVGHSMFDGCCPTRPSTHPRIRAFPKPASTGSARLTAKLPLRSTPVLEDHAVASSSAAAKAPSSPAKESSSAREPANSSRTAETLRPADSPARTPTDATRALSKRRVHLRSVPHPGLSSSALVYTPPRLRSALPRSVIATKNARYDTLSNTLHSPRPASSRSVENIDDDDVKVVNVARDSDYRDVKKELEVFIDLDSSSDSEVRIVRVKAAKERTSRKLSPMFASSPERKATSSKEMAVASEHGRTSPVPAHRRLSIPVGTDSELDEDEIERGSGYKRRERKAANPVEKRRRIGTEGKYRDKTSRRIDLETEGQPDEEILDGDSARTTPSSPIDVDATYLSSLRLDRPRKTQRRRKRSVTSGEIPTGKFYGSEIRVRSGHARRRSIRLAEAEEDEVLDGGDEQDIRFRLANKEEKLEIDALTRRSRSSMVVARIKEANIDLKVEDFGCLRGSRWLSDEVINSFVALINERNQAYFAELATNGSAKGKPESVSDSQGKKAGEDVGEIESKRSGEDFDWKSGNIFRRGRPRVHVFNSFFFLRLVGKEYDYNGVRRWLKRANRKITELDLVLVPINISNLHWVLAAIDLRGKRFIYCDSTFGKDCLDSLNVLRQWLKDEVGDKCGEEKLKEMDIDSWKAVKNPEYLPKQLDGGSCGIFTLFMAEFFERGVKPTFTQNNVRALRQRTALFLSSGQLPE